MYKRTQGGAILKTEFEENKKARERKRASERAKERGGRKRTRKNGRGGGGSKSERKLVHVRATIVRRSNWIPFVFYGLFNRLIRIRPDRGVCGDDEGSATRGKELVEASVRLTSRNERNSVATRELITFTMTILLYIILSAVVNVLGTKDAQIKGKYIRVVSE